MERATKLYVYGLIILIVSWLSCYTAHTPISGEWVFDKPVNPRIIAAMQKSGPGYLYELYYDDTLHISKDMKRSWERLRY
jgi:hypothetical protein